MIFEFQYFDYYLEDEGWKRDLNVNYYLRVNFIDIKY